MKMKHFCQVLEYHRRETWGAVTTPKRFCKVQKNCTTAIYLFYSTQKMYSCIFTSQLQIGILEKMYNCYFSSQMQKNCTTFMASVICPYLPFRITCKICPGLFLPHLRWQMCGRKYLHIDANYCKV